eukprot:scaffold118805_cov24-Tisochrysis_lutea.AAC.1
MSTAAVHQPHPEQPHQKLAESQEGMSSDVPVTRLKAIFYCVFNIVVSGKREHAHFGAAPVSSVFCLLTLPTNINITCPRLMPPATSLCPTLHSLLCSMHCGEWCAPSVICLLQPTNVSHCLLPLTHICTPLSNSPAPS